MTKSLKQLICRKEKAYAQKDLNSFKKRRNEVNCERKSCRKRYYQNKVEHLKSCSSQAGGRKLKS